MNANAATAVEAYKIMPMLSNHPQLTVIMLHLKLDYSNYKYTVYRCACKIVALQNFFFTSSIPYKLVLAVLTRHGLSNANADLMIPPFQLNALINDIYVAAEKLGQITQVTPKQMETAVVVLTNFFWDIYDTHRRHSISLLEIKTIFFLLCRSNACHHLWVEYFYKSLYEPRSKCVLRFRFEQLLNVFTKFLSHIGEGTAYGSQNINHTLEQCFAKCHNEVGLTEHQFYGIWTKSDTRFKIYINLIALVKRLEDAEKLVHNNMCESCHTEKIIGIRFKCKQCKTLSLCLKCFATGYYSNKHEPHHRMYEMFTEDGPPKNASHYLAKLCTMIFPWKNSEERTKLCNTNETGAANETELVTLATINSSDISAVNASEKDADVAVKANNSKELQPLTRAALNASNASERLQIIIDRVLLQNLKIEKQINCVQTTTPEEISIFLKAHKEFLNEIIKDMRIFSKISQSNELYPTSSTPTRSMSVNKATNLDCYSNVGSQLSHSINGADLNRSYVDANKSDYSLKDISTWFNQRRMSMPAHSGRPSTQSARSQFTNVKFVPNNIDSMSVRETDMINFKLLLNKVKEIVEDAYSDNTELAEATQNLENVLDDIIQSEEENRRKSE